MPFIPFGVPDPTQAPWSPFITLDTHTYFGLRTRYDQYLPDRLPTATAETAYIRLFRIITIIATSRITSSIATSGVWDNCIKAQTPPTKISQEIGFLYDDLFFALALEAPCEKWYTKMLAVRDSMYRHWISNPRTHSKLSTHAHTHTHTHTRKHWMFP